jgi:hypothetical protein
LGNAVNVGIGTIDPKATLAVVKNSTALLMLSSAASAGGDYMLVDSAGNVGLGTIAPVAGLAVMNGNVGIGTWSPLGKMVVLGGNVGIGTYNPQATLDAGGTGATLRIPFGSAPTVSASGQVGIGTVNHQFWYNSQGTKRVLSYQKTRCVIVDNLGATDDNFPMGSFVDPVTVTSVWCTCSGTCSTMAQMSLEDGAGNAMTHTTPTCTAASATPTAQSVTAANTLTARETLAFDVDNTPSPDGADTYSYCVSYTLNEAP